MSDVLVPPARLMRWLQNFTRRHGATKLDGALSGTAADGSTFTASLPFSRSYDGPPDIAAFGRACAPPEDWGLLLVRKGGFAVARVHGTEMAESKTGQRHVQGRTKAGGQSQQRFARRRENQARVAFEAAGDHAIRILGDVPLLVVGGEKAAVTEVLKEPRLAGLTVVGDFLTVPDPRRSVLESALADACSARIRVTNT
ncbi:MAG: hypothetical protein J7518_05395 [Nocardioidaceae bacterium]|nr:hypothetical protein [Nocardioidaceae bacterium]